MASAESTSAFFRANVDALTGAIGAISTTLAVSQSASEQRVREEGGSGVTGVRNNLVGVEAYNEGTHVGPGSFLSIHDHADLDRTIGMGEISAVINGVPFQTRHNDYRLTDPDVSRQSFDFPDVPPAVLALGNNVTAQIVEMREWFKAWQEDDWSVRDFRPYFRPVLCVLEGAWLEDDRFKDPFDSDRHQVDASSWSDLYRRLWYTFASGGKHSSENLSFQPTSVRNLVNGTWPQLSRWEYRIKCNRLSDETHIPPSVLRVTKDL